MTEKENRVFQCQLCLTDAYNKLEAAKVKLLHGLKILDAERAQKEEELRLAVRTEDISFQRQKAHLELAKAEAERGFEQ